MQIKEVFCLSNNVGLWQFLVCLCSGDVIAEQSLNEPTLGLALGQLGGLPALESVAVDTDGGEGHEETVPHVDNAHNLDISVWID